MPENKGLERFPVDPAKFGGYKDFTLAGHEDLVRQLVAEQPDITLAELEDRLRKKKITVGKSSISRFLHHLKLPFKNSLRASEQDRPDVAAARRALQRRQKRLDPRRLVFIDETAASTTITRLYGRAPQGERLIQKVLHGNWKTVTCIAALRNNRVTAPFVLEGAMNGETFKAYVEQFLAPTLKKGDIVFMDNASVHMVEGVEEAIQARGAMLFYLPAYSPDFNPIEQLFAKLKSMLRKIAAYSLKQAAYTVDSL
jgi:transposase/arginine repressor